MDMYEVVATACALAGALLMVTKLTKWKKGEMVLSKIKSALEGAKSLFPSKNKKDKK